MLDVSVEKASTPSPVEQLAPAPQNTPRSRPRDMSYTPPKHRGLASPGPRPSHPSVCGRRLRRYSL